MKNLSVVLNWMFKGSVITMIGSYLLMVVVLVMFGDMENGLLSATIGLLGGTVFGVSMMLKYSIDKSKWLTRLVLSILIISGFWLMNEIQLDIWVGYILGWLAIFNSGTWINWFVKVPVVEEVTEKELKPEEVLATELKAYGEDCQKQEEPEVELVHEKVLGDELENELPVSEPIIEGEVQEEPHVVVEVQEEPKVDIQEVLDRKF